MKHHMEFMGFRVRDKVTGFEGIVTIVAFDLFGCVQAAVTPRVKADDKKDDSLWFDVSRLERTDTEAEPVMPVPTFEAPSAATPGGQDKSGLRRG